MKNTNKNKISWMPIILIISFMLTMAINTNLVNAEEDTSEDYNLTWGLDNKVNGWDFFISSLLGVFIFQNVLNFQDYSADIFIYLTKAWQAEEGGENCQALNDFIYPFGEYQCHSLGSDCILINKGTPDQKCIHDNPNDNSPPTISILEKTKQEGYRYIKTGATWPEEYGFKIMSSDQREGGCLPPFEEVIIGIETSEYAQCKIDALRQPASFSGELKDLFDKMSQLMESSVYVKEHVVTLPAAGFPSTDSLQGANFELELKNDYDYFIRCKDKNGNFNEAAFSVEFCIQDGPDTKAPIIKETNIPFEGEVFFNVTKYPLEIITDEPADCRWDFMDLDYDKMQYNMTDCSQNIADYSQGFEYGCRTTLTGIKKGTETNYYLKCEDKPWLDNEIWLIENDYTANDPPKAKRFANREPYVVSLMSTEQIEIDSITVNQKENGTILRDSVDPLAVYLEVRTSAGADEGNAKCKYKSEDGTFHDFYNDGSFDYARTHEQRLDLIPGEYNYSIKCNDQSNNVVEDSILFSVEIDQVPPIVTRIYYESGRLKIKTNEDANCAYSFSDCDYQFEGGVEMITSNGFEHFASWSPNFDLFIKCKDLFGNWPLPQNCTTIVRAFED